MLTDATPDNTFQLRKIFGLDTRRLPVRNATVTECINIYRADKMLSHPKNADEFLRQRQKRHGGVQTLQNAFGVPGQHQPTDQILLVLWFHYTTVLDARDIARLYAGAFPLTAVPMAVSDVKEIIRCLDNRYSANGDSWHISQRLEKPQAIGTAPCDHGLNCRAVKRSGKYVRQHTHAAEAATRLWKGSFAELLRCPRLHRDDFGSSDSSTDLKPYPSQISMLSPVQVRKARLQDPHRYGIRLEDSMIVDLFQMAIQTALATFVAFLWMNCIFVAIKAVGVAGAAEVEGVRSDMYTAYFVFAAQVPLIIICLDAIFHSYPRLTYIWGERRRWSADFRRALKELCIKYWSVYWRVALLSFWAIWTLDLLGLLSGKFLPLGVEVQVIQDWSKSFLAGLQMYIRIFIKGMIFFLGAVTHTYKPPQHARPSQSME